MDRIHLIWVFVQEIVEPILAIVAIVFAIVQFRDAHKTLGKLRAQNQGLVDIAESMSTRFIGPFPKNVSEIVEVVQRADRTLWIATDFADYGSYAAPTLYLRLSQAIAQKGQERNMDVKILHYSRSLSESTVREQISSDMYYGKKELPSERESDSFRNFTKMSGLTHESSYEEFIAALLKYQEDEASLFRRRGVEVRTTDHPLPAFLWIEDEEDCIFSWRYRNSPKRGYSFRTRDGFLLTDYCGLFQDLWSMNDPKANQLSEAKGAMPLVESAQ